MTFASRTLRILQTLRSPVPLAFATFCGLWGCSLKPVDTAKLRFDVEPQPSAPAPGGLEFASAPASITDMNCLFLNVMGPGIQPASEISRAVPYVFDYQFNLALQGDPCASYAGILSRFIPVQNGGSVEVNVPVGVDRLVQVLGMQTTSDFGCPSDNYVDELRRRGKVELESKVPDLFEVGRTRISTLSGDVSLSINNQYTYANPKQITHCGGSGNSGGGGYAVDLDRLEVWLSPSTLGLPSTPVNTWANSSRYTDRPGDFTSGGVGTPTVSSSGGVTIDQSNIEYFNVSSDPGGRLNNQNFTYIVIFSPNTHAASTTASLLELRYGSTGTKYRGIYVRKTSNTTDPVTIVASTASGGSGSSGATLIGTKGIRDNGGDLAMITLRHSEATGYSDLRINGRDVPDAVQTGETVPAQNFTLARLSTTTVSPSQGTSARGRIGEVLIYSKFLNSNDLINTECKLAHDWGILGATNCPNP